MRKDSTLLVHAHLWCWEFPSACGTGSLHWVTLVELDKLNKGKAQTSRLLCIIGVGNEQSEVCKLYSYFDIVEVFLSCACLAITECCCAQQRTMRLLLTCTRTFDLNCACADMCKRYSFASNLDKADVNRFNSGCSSERIMLQLDKNWRGGEQDSKHGDYETVDGFGGDNVLTMDDLSDAD